MFTNVCMHILSVHTVLSLQLVWLKTVLWCCASILVSPLMVRILIDTLMNLFKWSPRLSSSTRVFFNTICLNKILEKAAS